MNKNTEYRKPSDVLRQICLENFIKPIRLVKMVNWCMPTVGHCGPLPNKSPNLYGCMYMHRIIHRRELFNFRICMSVLVVLLTIMSDTKKIKVNSIVIGISDYSGHACVGLNELYPSFLENKYTEAVEDCHSLYFVMVTDPGICFEISLHLMQIMLTMLTN